MERYLFLKRVLLIASGFSLLILPVFVARVANFSNHCVESYLFSDIAFRSVEEGDVFVAHCSWREFTQSAFDRPLANEDLEIVHQIQKSNQVSHYLPIAKTRQVLIIDSTDPFALEESSKQVRVGREFVVDPGRWQQLLYRAWFKNRLPFQRRLLSSFLVRDRNDKDWWQYIQNHREYCLSPDRFSEDYEQCEAQDEISMEALTPLMSEILWRISEHLSFADRMGFFHRILEAKLDPPNIDKRSSAAELEEPLEKFIRQTVDETTDLDSEGQQELVAQVARSLHLRQPLNLVIDVRTPLPEEQYSHLLDTSREFGQQAVALIRDQMTTFLPEGHRVAASALKALQYILITCKIPTLKDVSELKGEHVTIFHWCAGSGSFNWRDLMSSPSPVHGAFFHLHGPSLRLVLNLHPEAGSLRVDNVAAIAKELGWEKVAWNPHNSDFEPLSAINTVVSYRWDEKPRSP